MATLRYKLGLFNALSKIIFGILFLTFMPLMLERINTIQTDNKLIEQREQVINLIADWGVEILIEDASVNAFGSYNILKEEYISLERIEPHESYNFIEVTRRMVEGEIIDYRVLNYSFMVDGDNYLLEIGKSLSSIRQTEKNIQTFTIIFLLIFVLVSFITDFSFATRLIKPLEAITSKLRKTSSVNLSESRPLNTTTTEFIYLDKTLRDLMHKIDDLFQKEKQITANISHELLTPVSILRSKLENMLAIPDLNEEIAVGIGESLKTLHRLKTMVNSLLLIARVESHQYLKEDSFTIAEILKEIIEELTPISDDKGVSIRLNFAEIILINKANRALMFTMFYNVVNNAIKFTPEGGDITLTCGRDNYTFFTSVKDSGNGMNPAQIENLFSRFNKKMQPDDKGSGVGLAIAKSIADLHDITIVVKSQPGQGSEFIFRFFV